MLKLKYYGFHVSRYGARVSRVYSLYFSYIIIMAGWIAEILFMLFFAFIAV